MSARGETILVLEEGARRWSVICALLDATPGVTAFHVATTAHAADMLDAVRFDLAIIDVGLAQERAFHFIQGIRRRLYGGDHAMPIVALAPVAHERVITRARDAGVNALIAKPLTAAGVALQLTRVREDRRAFIESAGYVGPDRRHADDPNYAGRERRSIDTRDEVLIG